MSPLFSSSLPHDEVPILIVGGGPSGLLLAYLLAQLNGTVQTVLKSIIECANTTQSDL